MKSLLILFLAIPTPKKTIHPCKKDWSMLQLEQKIELSIGCSTVNGEYVYSFEKLERIYGNEKVEVYL